MGFVDCWATMGRPGPVSTCRFWTWSCWWWWWHWQWKHARPTPLPELQPTQRLWNISKLFNYDKDVLRAGSTLTLTTFILTTLLKRLGSAKRYAGQIYRVPGCLNKKIANRILRTMLHLLSMAKFRPTAPHLPINDLLAHNSINNFLTHPVVSNDNLSQVLHHPSNASDHKPVIVKLELKENQESWKCILLVKTTIKIIPPSPHLQGKCITCWAEREVPHGPHVG